uniref:E3 ubiquitin-protein ligase SIRP1-like n=1 Tax=Erigeron canadensis TaxID=72917 RepID=UPI001CB8F787|nr:E3 ubiquitin-protein ligase SIRP1-like [Erigeron canadensis]
MARFQMEEGSESTRYWCHECSRAVETFMDSEMIKCSFCHDGFVEEMDSSRTDHHPHNHHADDSLSLVVPILRSSPLRRRRRSRATIPQLLQAVWSNINSNNNNNGYREWGQSYNRERDRERVIVINVSNQTVIVQGGGSVGASGGNLFDSGGLQPNHPIGSIGDYFVWPGLELLLQRLAENDPNRYGTPPAQKQAVEAMLTVIIEEDSVQCAVCLEDVEVGNEAKEMPCKHRFHGYCILPWLELHSSCPVCRYQLPPSDDSKHEPERESSLSLTVNSSSLTNGMTMPAIENGETEGRNTRPYASTLSWPFNSLFSSTPVAQIESPPLIINPTTESGSGSGLPVNESNEDEGGQ